MTRIDTMMPGMDDRTLSPRPSDLANQRDSWLRQMELAQLTDMSLSGQTTARDDEGKRAVRSPLAGAPSHNEKPDTQARRKSTAAIHRDTLPSTVQPVYQFSTASAPQVTQTHTPVADAHTRPAATGSSAQQLPPQPLASPSAPTAFSPTEVPHSVSVQSSAFMPVPARPLPHAQSTPSIQSGNAQSMPLAAPAAIDQSMGRQSLTSPAAAITTSASQNELLSPEAAASQSMPTYVAASPALASQLPPQILPGRSSTSAIESLDSPLQAAPITSTTPGLAARYPQSGVGVDEEALTPAAPAEQSELAEKQDFQKRLMHLTGDESNLSLWIRDSALNQAQTQNLVYRLVSDFAGSGMRLRGININGKPSWQASDSIAADRSRTESGTANEETHAIQGAADTASKRK